MPAGAPADELTVANTVAACPGASATLAGAIVRVHPPEIDASVLNVVVAHEAVRFCGIGGEIAAQITEEAFDYLDGPPLRIGAPSSPVPYSPVREKEWVPDSQDIIAAANTLVGG